MQKFGQRILERALRGAMKAGLAVGRIEIRPDGTLVIFAKADEQNAFDFLDAELEDWRKKHGTH